VLSNGTFRVLAVPFDGELAVGERLRLVRAAEAGVPAEERGGGRAG